MFFYGEYCHRCLLQLFDCHNHYHNNQRINLDSTPFRIKNKAKTCKGQMANKKPRLKNYLHNHVLLNVPI